jgi:RHS repeat-associated protein
MNDTKAKATANFKRFAVWAVLLTGVLGVTANAEAYLHPQIGRFVSRDPKDSGKPGGGYHDGMNLYEYVRSGPVSLRDPSGLALGPQVERPGHIENRWVQPKKPEVILSELWEKSNALSELAKKFQKDNKKDMLLNARAFILDGRIDYLWSEMKRSYAFYHGEIPTDVEKRKLGPNLIIGTLAGGGQEGRATELAENWVAKGGRPAPRPHTGPIPWDPTHPGHVDRKISCKNTDTCCVLSSKMFLFKAMIAAHMPVVHTHAHEMKGLMLGLGNCIKIHKSKCTKKKKPIKIPVPVFVPAPVPAPVPIRPKPVYGVPGIGRFRIPAGIPIPIPIPIPMPAPIPIPIPL